MNEQLRALFSHTGQVVYLNHAAVSPPPTKTVEAVAAQMRDVAGHGSLNYRKWVAVKESARRMAALMLGARPEQVAFTRNTSDGLSTIANGLSWRAGENVVTFRREFPSNVYPWMNLESRGVETRRVPTDVSGRLDLEKLELAGHVGLGLPNARHDRRPSR